MYACFVQLIGVPVSMVSWLKLIAAAGVVQVVGRSCNAIAGSVWAGLLVYLYGCWFLWRFFLHWGSDDGYVEREAARGWSGSCRRLLWFVQIAGW
ncbi:hypothetical protein LOK49_LG04G00670 [Camellia lanceoleosa]|uniref:Uncharacterized protein n=1 Tax=Camellia lanceoleosa TaxID=1840588 RepID=A0ACC0I1L2_9ERIC|nr:hypothetical protein LOK49_LG04G00670 [Camellia lanceoleosa]